MQTVHFPDLRAVIRASGLRFDYVAAEMGISPQNLNNKLNNPERFLPEQRIDFAALMHKHVADLFPDEEPIVEVA